MKKIAAILVACALCLSVLPMAASAASSNDCGDLHSCKGSHKAVVFDGVSTYIHYDTLAEAVIAANTGKTIVLLDDVDLLVTPLTIPNDGNYTFTLDLYGHNITGDVDTTGLILVGDSDNYSTLNIINSKSDDPAEIKNTSNGAGRVFVINNKSVVNIAYGDLASSNKSEITINSSDGSGGGIAVFAQQTASDAALNSGEGVKMVSRSTGVKAAHADADGMALDIDNIRTAGVAVNFSNSTDGPGKIKLGTVETTGGTANGVEVAKSAGIEIANLKAKGKGLVITGAGTGDITITESNTVDSVVDYGDAATLADRTLTVGNATITGSNKKAVSVAGDMNKLSIGSITMSDNSAANTGVYFNGSGKTIGELEITGTVNTGTNSSNVGVDVARGTISKFSAATGTITANTGIKLAASTTVGDVLKIGNLNGIADNGVGIDIADSATVTNITVGDITATGSGKGINVRGSLQNSGNLTVTGTVTTVNGDGIVVASSKDAKDIVINDGATVKATGTGKALNLGGLANVTVKGTVQAVDTAIALTGAGANTVTVSGTVEATGANAKAIDVAATGTEKINVSAGGNVLANGESATNGKAILTSGSGVAAITVNGTVKGKLAGVEIGGGDTSTVTVGNVTLTDFPKNVQFTNKTENKATVNSEEVKAGDDCPVICRHSTLRCVAGNIWRQGKYPGRGFYPTRPGIAPSP